MAQSPESSDQGISIETLFGCGALLFALMGVGGLWVGLEEVINPDPTNWERASAGFSVAFGGAVGAVLLGISWHLFRRS